MEKVQGFVDYLNSFVNRGIYVWGGQTEVIKGGLAYKDDSFKKALNTAEEWIMTHASSKSNGKKAVKMYNARKDKFEVIPCVDCSGIGMNYLYNKMRYFKSDMTANGMMGKCKLISKSDLKKGDWVFRTYKTGKKKGTAYHIGYVVDDALHIVHSKGSADGVVKEAFSSTYWNKYGRPDIFADEINGHDTNNNEIVFTRNLKYTKPMMTGEDVKELQRLLNEANNADLGTDGKFGKLTRDAVKKYQKLKGLTVDGIAGKNTITALGGTWRG